MFISRENALKAYQHISYYSIQRDQFRKKNLIQNQIKIFTKTHQIAHFFKIFSLVACPIACVQLIHGRTQGGARGGSCPPPLEIQKYGAPPRIT